MRKADYDLALARNFSETYAVPARAVSLGDRNLTVFDLHDIMTVRRFHRYRCILRKGIAPVFASVDRYHGHVALASAKQQHARKAKDQQYDGKNDISLCEQG